MKEKEEKKEEEEEGKEVEEEGKRRKETGGGGGGRRGRRRKMVLRKGGVLFFSSGQCCLSLTLLIVRGSFVLASLTLHSLTLPHPLSPSLTPSPSPPCPVAGLGGAINTSIGKELTHVVFHIPIRSGSDTPPPPRECDVGVTLR